jgi:AraC-like DNA-binding protein
LKAVLEKIYPKVLESFAVQRFAVPRFNCPYHHHPEVELTWISRSSGQRLVGNHLASFEPGDLVLLGSGLPHTYFNPPEFDDGPEGAEATVIQFLPDFAGGWMQEMGELQQINSLLRAASCGLKVGSQTSEKVFPLLDDLLTAKGAGRLILLLQMLAVLAEAHDLTALADAGFAPKLNHAQGEKIERVCNWLTTHYQESISLPQVAELACMTPPAFSRFFHKTTGRTLTRFITELRIGHASRLLIEMEESVATIAYASGFENLSNFNRHFRELKRLSPVEFRKCLGQLEQRSL